MAEMTPWGTSHAVDGDEVELVCLTDHIDDVDRPLAVLVHGFPDSPATWRHLAPMLVEAGFRVAAPWLRGYAPSSLAADGCYQTAASAADLDAVHHALGGDARAVLVGHDWGAPIVYTAAAVAPDRWSRVVGMAVPPGPALATSFLVDLDQLQRSWYMFFFQHPLADMVVPSDDLAFVDRLWAQWSPGYDPSDDLPWVKAALAGPERVGAALAYYRAALGGVGLRDDLADAQAAGQAIPPQPTLYLHGSDDGCVGATIAEMAAADAPDHLTVEIVDGVGHFLQLEAPAPVGRRVVEFLT